MYKSLKTILVFIQIKNKPFMPSIGLHGQLHGFGKPCNYPCNALFSFLKKQNDTPFTTRFTLPA